MPTKKTKKQASCIIDEFSLGLELKVNGSEFIQVVKD